MGRAERTPNHALALRLGSGVAREVLNANADDLDANTRKVRELCARELEEAAEMGTLGRFTHTLLNCIRRSVFGDVTANEGMNSLIKRINQRCPSIKLPLLASRCGLKHALGVADQSGAKKWTDVRTFARTILDECVQGQTSARLAWVMPNGGSRRYDVRMRPPMRNLLRWCRSSPQFPRRTGGPFSYCMLLHHRVRRPSYVVCVCVGPLRMGSHAYLVVEKHRNSSYLAQLTVIRDTDAQEVKVCLDVPFVFTPALATIGAYHAAVHEQGHDAEPFELTLHSIKWMRSQGVVLRSSKEVVAILRPARVPTRRKRAATASAAVDRGVAGADVDDDEDAFVDALAEALALDTDDGAGEGDPLMTWQPTGALLRSEVLASVIRRRMLGECEDGDADPMEEYRRADAIAMAEHAASLHEAEVIHRASDELPQQTTLELETRCRPEFEGAEAHASEVVFNMVSGNIRRRGIPGPLPEQPQPPQPLQQIWATHAVRGLRLLAARARSSDRELGENGELSLVNLEVASAEFGVRGKHAVFVRWLNASGRLGQVVHLDNRGCATWPAPAPSMHPSRRIRGEIIHPAIGVRLARSRINRLPVLKDIMELQSMCEASRTGTLPSTEGCMCCGGIDAPLETCCLCLMQFHRTCSIVIHWGAQARAELGMSTAVADAAIRVPVSFRDCMRGPCCDLTA